jgi:hypothetical protein
MAVDGFGAFPIFHSHHFQDILHVLPITKLLIVELPVPEHSHLPPPICKQANKSEHARLTNQSEGELNRRGNAQKHPGDTSDEESDASGDEVEIGGTGGVESTQIAEEHSWEDDSCEGQPGTLLVVDRIDGWHLQLERVVVFVQKQRVVANARRQV